jgi:hypothetical protein
MTSRNTSLGAFRSLLVALSIVVVIGACGRDEAPPAAGETGAAAAAAPSPTPTGVAFEPAYPADVSKEGLSQQDVTQQETPHSHDGGEEHTHAGEKDDAKDEGDHGHPH